MLDDIFLTVMVGVPLVGMYAAIVYMLLNGPRR